MSYDLTVWIVNEGLRCRSVGFTKGEAIKRAWQTDVHTLSSAGDWWLSMEAQGMTCTEHDVSMVPVPVQKPISPTRSPSAKARS